jgi:CMP-N,N'-diacetyllegionaminic acid synthase
MLKEHTILAVVPARSGSKGIPNKNMRLLLGISLIGWAGRCLAAMDWLDGRIISTDSSVLAAEGNRYGLESPFLRPEPLATDTASAVEMAIHALVEAEKHYLTHFDVILIIEPTSPLRTPEDIKAVTGALIDSGADSVVAVSSLDPKWHPDKVLTVTEGRLGYYSSAGSSIIYRQKLGRLYWRNGICYALRRRCLLEKQAIISEYTMGFVIDREVINIDREIELEWAEALMRTHGYGERDIGSRGNSI